MEQTVVIDKYIRKVKLSSSRRAKYYEKGKTKVKAKKYQDKLKYDYRRVNGFGFREFLVDLETGFKVLANPKAAGTPNWFTINGQGIYNGKIKEHSRATVMESIAKSIRPYISTFKPVKPEEYPIELYLGFHDEEGVFDLDNRATPYLKSIQDTMTKQLVIEDDNVSFIRRIIFEFIPVESTEDRKLVLTIKSI